MRRLRAADVCFAMILLLQAVEESYGWIQQRRRVHGADAASTILHNQRCRSSTRALQLSNSSDKDVAFGSTSRRSFIVAMSTIASTTLFPRAAPIAAQGTTDSDRNNLSEVASRDSKGMLEQFGKDIEAAKWPQTSSPLPTPTKTPNSTDDLSAPPRLSDLERALNQAKRSKNVGPLTHG